MGNLEGNNEELQRIEAPLQEIAQMALNVISKRGRGRFANMVDGVEIGVANVAIKRDSWESKPSWTWQKQIKLSRRVGVPIQLVIAVNMAEGPLNPESDPPMVVNIWFRDDVDQANKDAASHDMGVKASPYKNLFNVSEEGDVSYNAGDLPPALIERARDLIRTFVETPDQGDKIAKHRSETATTIANLLGTKL